MKASSGPRSILSNVWVGKNMLKSMASMVADEASECKQQIISNYVFLVSTNCRQKKIWESKIVSWSFRSSVPLAHPMGHQKDPVLTFFGRPCGQEVSVTNSFEVWKSVKKKKNVFQIWVSKTSSNASVAAVFGTLCTIVAPKPHVLTDGHKCHLSCRTRPHLSLRPITGLLQHTALTALETAMTLQDESALSNLWVFGRPFRPFRPLHLVDVDSILR